MGNRHQHLVSILISVQWLQVQKISLFVDHPIKREVTNWSDVFSLLEYVLEDALQINVRDHPILLTEIGLMPKKHKEKLTEVS